MRHVSDTSKGKARHSLRYKSDTVATTLVSTEKSSCWISVSRYSVVYEDSDLDITPPPPSWRWRGANSRVYDSA
jgi:hypothetical protein